MLSAEKVVKGFPGAWEHFILDEVGFDVKSGEVHLLLGEEGSGKTVLANVLSRFYLASRGQIFVRENQVIQRAWRSRSWLLHE